jgi:hypothetical protein
MIINNTCPPGVICINNTNAMGIIVVFLIIVYVVNKDNYKKLYEKVNFLQNKQLDHSQHLLNNKNNGMIMEKENSNYNMEVIKNPLYPPLKRNYNLEHEIDNLQGRLNINTRKSATERQDTVMDTPNGLPINIETRGSGGDFQQVGMLYKNTITDDTKAPGNNTENNVLPLYGKPTYKGSTKWLYYTETDKLNPVKIPVNVNSKDCTDEYGCEELYDGSNVDIPSYNGAFNVKIYKFNKPKYIPYV